MVASKKRAQRLAQHIGHGLKTQPGVVTQFNHFSVLRRQLVQSFPQRPDARIRLVQPRRRCAIGNFLNRLTGSAAAKQASSASLGPCQIPHAVHRDAEDP